MGCNRNFPSMKRRYFREFVAPGRVGWQLSILPPAAGCGANAPLIEGLRHAFQRGGTGCADRGQDRQQIGDELVCHRALYCAAQTSGVCPVVRIAESGASCLLGGERGLGALGDQPPFLLRQHGIEMQHERIGIPAEFGDDEGHSLRHQARDECHFAREPVQFGHGHAAFR